MDSLGRWQISPSQKGRSGNYETQVPGRAGQAGRREPQFSFQRDTTSFSGINSAGKLSEALGRCIFMRNRVDNMAISCAWGLHTHVPSSRDPPSQKARVLGALLPPNQQRDLGPVS